MSDDILDRWILAGGPQSFEEFVVAEARRTAPPSILVPYLTAAPVWRRYSADDLPTEVEFAYNRYVRAAP